MRKYLSAALAIAAVAVIGTAPALAASKHTHHSRQMYMYAPGEVDPPVAPSVSDYPNPIGHTGAIDNNEALGNAYPGGTYR